MSRLERLNQMHTPTFLDLPNEILSHILDWSREPSFIHVCLRTWKELPSFVRYTKCLAGIAFYEPIYNHLYSDDPIVLSRIFKLPSLESPLSETERVELQARLLCSYWFTADHLVAITNIIMFSAIQESLRMLKVEAHPQHLTQIQRILWRFGQLWKIGDLYRQPGQSVRWDQPGQSFIMSINPLNLVVKGPVELHSGQALPPWRQEPQNLRTFGLDIPELPLQLIESVAERDERSFGLLRLLYFVRVDFFSPPCLFGLKTETRATIERCVKKMLASDIEPVDPNDEYLKLLLLFDGMAGMQFQPEDSRLQSFRPTQCPCTMKTEVERKSIYVRAKYYEFVTDEGNTEGFERLMKLNPAVCIPQPSIFRAIFNDPKRSNKVHTQKHKQIYLKAWEKKQAARKGKPEGKNSTGVAQQLSAKRQRLDYERQHALSFSCSKSRSKPR